MKARLLSVLITMTLAAGCAQAFHESRPASPEETTTQWHTNPYKNAETEQEYLRRIEWEIGKVNGPGSFADDIKGIVAELIWLQAVLRVAVV